MRTTLFFTAAFAAINFAFQTEAISIPTTNMERSATELAQVDASLSAFIEVDAEQKERLPGDMFGLRDMMKNGHSEYEHKHLFPSIKWIIK